MAVKMAGMLRVAKRGVANMPGLMQDQALNLNRFVWRAEKLFFDKEIITYSVRRMPHCSALISLVQGTPFHQVWRLGRPRSQACGCV